METTDEDVLERFVDLVGAGRVFARPPRCEHHKPSFRWQVTGREAHRVLELLRPWLGVRRAARAVELLAECPVPANVRGRKGITARDARER